MGSFTPSQPLEEDDYARMSANRSIEFFDRQFERQVLQPDLALNPFEQAALPWLTGRVLDFGCGMGNLAVAAARAGCSVLALDASAVAIRHLQDLALTQGLGIEARQADLSRSTLTEDFDAIVSIGLLMFLDRAAVTRALADLKIHLRPGGILAINVLVEGTTYMAMFDPGQHCLFARDELLQALADWELIASEFEDFAAPGDTVKAFQTVIARKPAAPVP